MARKPLPSRYPYQDLPGMPHLFADSLEHLILNDDVAHLTLTVTRFEQAPQNPQLRGKRCTAARLVLTRDLLVELHQEIGRLIGSPDASGPNGGVQDVPTVQ